MGWACLFRRNSFISKLSKNVKRADSYKRKIIFHVPFLHSWLFLWLPPVRKWSLLLSKLCSNFRKSLLFSQARKSWDRSPCTMTRIISVISSLFLQCLLIFSIIGPVLGPDFSLHHGNSGSAILNAHLLKCHTCHPAPAEKRLQACLSSLGPGWLRKQWGRREAARAAFAQHKGTKAERCNGPFYTPTN